MGRLWALGERALGRPTLAVQALEAAPNMVHTGGSLLRLCGAEEQQGAREQQGAEAPFLTPPPSTARV